MTKPRLIYFDFAASRGEECRLALHVAGIDFEDVRVKGPDWPAMKTSMPFGARRQNSRKAHRDMVPMRPKPDCTSSQIKMMPWRVQISRTPL